MRVTLVNHRYLPFQGGSELYIQKVAEWFARNGAEARVLTTNAFDLEYFWDGGARTVNARALEVINGVQVQRLPIRHLPMSRFLFPVSRRGMGELSRVYWQGSQPFRSIARYLPFVPDLAKELKNGPRPDVVIATNLGLEGLALTALEASRSIGAVFVLFPFAHLGAGQDAIARRYVSMPHQRMLVREADMVVALTKLEARYLIDLAATPFRVIVAGAGVDLQVNGCEKTADCEHSENADAVPLILSIGALARDKGTPDLVEASRILKARGFDHRLVLVGPEMSSFTRWFETSGATACDWIERVGTVTEEVKQELLASADVLALVSRTESFGIVYLEAWAYGKPVIGADVGAVSEVIDDGVDGLLVPFGDAPATAGAVERFVRDREFASRLGEAGKAKARQYFGWNSVFERLNDGFKDVLGLEIGG